MSASSSRILSVVAFDANGWLSIVARTDIFEHAIADAVIFGHP
jgi:hypothetical protein